MSSNFTSMFDNSNIVEFEDAMHSWRQSDSSGCIDPMLVLMAKQEAVGTDAEEALFDYIAAVSRRFVNRTS